jgi:hypothetical protein
MIRGAVEAAAARLVIIGRSAFRFRRVGRSPLSERVHSKASGIQACSEAYAAHRANSSLSIPSDF